MKAVLAQVAVALYEIAAVATDEAQIMAAVAHGVPVRRGRPRNVRVSTTHSDRTSYALSAEWTE